MYFSQKKNVTNPPVLSQTALTSLRTAMPKLKEKYPNGKAVSLTYGILDKKVWQAEIQIPESKDHPLVLLEPNGDIKTPSTFSVSRQLLEGEEIADIKTGSIQNILDSDQILVKAQSLGADQEFSGDFSGGLNVINRITCDSPVALETSVRNEFTKECDELAIGNLWVIQWEDKDSTVAVALHPQTGKLIYASGTGPKWDNFQPHGWSCTKVAKWLLIACTQKS